MHHPIKQTAELQYPLVSACGANGDDRNRADLRTDANLLLKSSDRFISHAMGQELRAIRRGRKMTIADLARATGLSTSMLSRTENGHVSPSINTLRLLSRALSTPIIAFFRSYEKELDVQIVKSKADLETNLALGFKGIQHLLLSHFPSSAGKLLIEAYVVLVRNKSLLKPDSNYEGIKLIYIMDGELVYRHGAQLFQLCPGDSLSFYGGILHGPERIITSTVRYVSVSRRLRH